MKLSSIVETASLTLLVLILSLTPISLHAGNKTADVLVNIVQGKIEGVDTLRYNQNEKVAITINSDKPMELHVHGYDITLNLKANELAILEFDAVTAGRFAVTQHDAHGGDSHGAIFYIEIYPE
ncbi:MAG TPA: hypothetical protein VIM93_00330 [Kangiella sp.]|uniref:hypothetical protein n=1 Tax=Kangiella sp. TaxID=1920245 RepID=UPI002F92EC8B